MKVWIISYSNLRRNSQYICGIWLDKDKALAQLLELTKGHESCYYQFDEFLVSE